MEDTGHRAPLFVALTLDVDADANRAAPGQADAVSPAGAARFDACRSGLAAVRAILTRHPLPVTLFWEGRALTEMARADPDLIASFADDPLAEHGCHGYRHEDYAGTVSGRAMPRAEIESGLDAVEAAFRDVLRRSAAGFRAPYCRMTDDLAAALAARGYRYDSSITVEAPSESRLRPCRMPQAPSVWELPLCRARDAAGRPISGYVWQLCEGKRAAADYTEMVRALRAPCAGGLLQIALHPWHLLVGGDGVPVPGTVSGEAAGQLEALLGDLEALDGVEFSTASAYLESHTGSVRGDVARGDQPSGDHL